MSVKKSKKRKVATKRIVPLRTTKSRYVSFFVGIVTVVVIALVIFQYAQSNNYKTVLGEKSTTTQPLR